MILFENVSFRYRGEEGYVLEGMDLKVADGEFLALTGPSGIGKTTIIRLLLREIVPTAGRIMVDETEVSALKDSEVPFYRRKLGVIFQDFRLIKDRTAYENLNLSRNIYGWGVKESEARIRSVMKFLGIDHMHKRYPEEMSGGEQQKLCLARAILNDPGILLCDEPTRNLDPRSSSELMQLLELIRRQGKTVILVTHDIETMRSEIKEFRQLKLARHE
ncbi:MAG: ATP-binding cassette domain-containing protein [Lachnospiraceae bacterium]|nr:ATP-binding cassette domain-containing protein [Lachnospiraceae bacterium]